MRWHSFVVLFLTFAVAERKRFVSPSGAAVGDAALKIKNLDQEHSNYDAKLDAFSEFRTAVVRMRGADKVLEDSSENAAVVLDFLVDFSTIAPMQKKRIVEVLKKVLKSTQWMSTLLSNEELMKRMRERFTESELEFGLPGPDALIKEVPSAEIEPPSAQEEESPFSVAVKKVVALDENLGFENSGDEVFNELRVACLRAQLSPEVFDKEAEHARDVILFLIRLASTRRTLVRRVKEVTDLLRASKLWAQALDEHVEDAKSSIPEVALKALGWKGPVPVEPTPVDEGEGREDNDEIVEASTPIRLDESSSERAPLEPEEERKKSEERMDTHVEVPPPVAAPSPPVLPSVPRRPPQRHEPVINTYRRGRPGGLPMF
eukprot:TRINITY_DN7944_c1_g1_i1.p1 TRINITY_DN7944_c1_g1~~TRINITY_DN7944_c1_g1_i1.p1  ORF type:complete len:399 (-),score=71.66 TRINITY_DN7944_c1_g1_i1:223-1347(-)